MRNSVLGCGWLVVSLMPMACLFSASAGASMELFGYREVVQKQARKLFPKWDGVLRRAARDQAKMKNCVPDFFTWCFQNSLRKFKPTMRGKSRLVQLQSVSRFINKLGYKSDTINWGVRDYWAVRWEFFGKNKGDCEDYAIAKYYTLKELGFSIDAMRLVVVKDTNMDLGHAILLVDLDGKRYVLDNRGSGLSLQSKIIHYRPIYSLNEHNWWLYRASR